MSMREKPKEHDNNKTKKVGKLLNNIIQHNSANDHGRKAIMSPNANELQFKYIFTMEPGFGLGLGTRGHNDKGRHRGD